jgi:hypothetical protein
LYKHDRFTAGGVVEDPGGPTAATTTPLDLEV